MREEDGAGTDRKDEKSDLGLRHVTGQRRHDAGRGDGGYGRRSGGQAHGDGDEPPGQESGYGRLLDPRGDDAGDP